MTMRLTQLVLSLLWLSVLADGIERQEVVQPNTGAFVETKAQASIPKSCVDLQHIHGVTKVKSWLLEMSTLKPAETLQSMCDDALTCKRLLLPLMTEDTEHYIKKCPKDCSSNGVCIAGGVCICEPAWKGADCSVPLCPSLCNKRGTCKAGVCFCEPGFSGKHCEVVDKCPVFQEKICAGHGMCHRAKCFCDPGFNGTDCSLVSLCPNSCSNRGFCLHGQCFCPPGYTGKDCGVEAYEVKCPGNCSDHGVCIGGKCNCRPGFFGGDCSSRVQCPRSIRNLECDKHGKCLNGHCQCDSGFVGEDCSKKIACPLGKNLTCSGQGLCFEGRCHCFPGFRGKDCLAKAPCLNGCSGNGVCVDGVCHCLTNFYGDDCSKSNNWPPYKPVSFEQPVCPVPPTLEARLQKVAEESQCESMCSGVGVCLNGTCVCMPGRTGADCSESTLGMTCPGKCNGHGVCVFGKCRCMYPFSGPDCSQLVVPIEDVPTCPESNCNKHGQCIEGQCVCDQGFAGHDCGITIPCNDNCNGRGSCSGGICYCFPGFEGARCERETACPHGCSARGQCFYGKCFCDPHYAGDDCSNSPSCSKGCSLKHGVCVGEDQCMCEPGWWGIACSEKLQCENDCSNHGRCLATNHGLECVCNPEWVGSDCSRSIHDCANNCSRHGVCLEGACVCEPGFTGLDCSGRAGGSPSQAVFDNIVHDTNPEAEVTPKPTDAKLNAAKHPLCPTDLENLKLDLSDPVLKDLVERCQKGENPAVNAKQREQIMHALERGMGESAPDTLVNSEHSVAGPLPTAADTPHYATKLPHFGTEEGAAEHRFRSLSTATATTAVCPPKCVEEGHGVCGPAGTCWCKPGWVGEDCTTVVDCPNDCNNNGICKYGHCWCNSGFQGEACDVLTVEESRTISAYWIVAVVCAFTFLVGTLVGFSCGKRRFKARGSSILDGFSVDPLVGREQIRS